LVKMMMAVDEGNYDNNDNIGYDDDDNVKI
jgi:hypothetical protein